MVEHHVANVNVMGSNPIFRSKKTGGTGVMYVFTDDKIFDTEENAVVMSRWEAPVMQKMAEIVCHNKGNVLEIGFGMGIASDYIQQLNPKSHTIVEKHPQVLEKLNHWSKDKSVNILTGDWKDQKFDKYDGILYDVYNDSPNLSFLRMCHTWIKPGGKLAYFFPSNLFRAEMFPNTWSKWTITKVDVELPADAMVGNNVWNCSQFPVLEIDF